ncbi:MAG: hypothetical protein JRJ31_18280 [Deltaproteobacteria bacterium]|nr:hypothetical protein [Deltaproteobacteria bacterium]
MMRKATSALTPMEKRKDFSYFSDMIPEALEGNKKFYPIKVLCFIGILENLYGPVSASEITCEFHFVDKKRLPGPKRVYTTISLLRNKGLLGRIPVTAVRGGMAFGYSKAKFAFALTEHGKEVLRYIYPLNKELFKRNEFFMPVPLDLARTNIQQLMQWNSSLSKAQLASACLTLKLGQTVYVLKREHGEKFQKYFPTFPFVRFREVLLFFDKKISVRLQDSLTKIFRGTEARMYPEVIDRLREETSPLKQYEK